MLILFDHIHRPALKSERFFDRREKAEQMVKESEQKKKETIQALKGPKTSKGFTSRRGSFYPPFVGQLDPLL